ncbi:hypothetical protein RSSM_00773 [Rhodopirellula sallentina SM41]|uniref:Uncharacterized protein n=1 Tax=Rhodopirellula sallentina SM41 TaxID=1263870 RepID=M5U965_9BACT|nr:hypothetical protein RSSM_00773 [Rhodopirellula sallentina SM41]
MVVTLLVCESCCESKKWAEEPQQTTLSATCDMNTNPPRNALLEVFGGIDSYAGAIRLTHPTLRKFPIHMTGSTCLHTYGTMDAEESFTEPFFVMPLGAGERFS